MNIGPLIFTFNAANQSTRVSIPLSDDNVYELTESFTASLGFVSIAVPLVSFSPDNAIVTITDDDSMFRYNDKNYN